MAKRMVHGIMRDLEAEEKAYQKRSKQIQLAGEFHNRRKIADIISRYELEPDEFQTAEEKAIRLMENPRARSKYYVGRTGISEIGEVFLSDKTPTRESHGTRFLAVTGPFVTKAGAEVMAAPHGPQIQTVSDAERFAKYRKTKERAEEIMINRYDGYSGRIKAVRKNPRPVLRARVSLSKMLEKGKERNQLDDLERRKFRFSERMRIAKLDKALLRGADVNTPGNHVGNKWYPVGHSKYITKKNRKKFFSATLNLKRQSFLAGFVGVFINKKDAVEYASALANRDRHSYSVQKSGAYWGIRKV